MSRKSDSVKHSVNIKPNDSAEFEANDLGVAADDSNRLHYNTGSGSQRVLLAEDAFVPGFTDAENVQYDNTTSGLSATDVQAALDEIDSAVDGAESEIQGIQEDVAALATLSGVAKGEEDLGTFSGNTISDNETIKGALQELETALENLDPLPDQSGSAGKFLTTDGSTASWADVPPDSAADVSFTPSGSVEATDVQGAIEELDAEKQPLDADLTAIAATTGPGFLARTSGTPTFAMRTIRGTPNQVGVQNGNGIDGNPILSFLPDPIFPGNGAATLPKGDDSERPDTPQSGMLRFNTEQLTFEGHDGSSWGPIAGGGGGVNYIKANDGNTLTGWSLRTYDTPAAAPSGTFTEGATAIDLVTYATNPLRGTSSFILVRDATDAQGQAVVYPFTVDIGDTLAVLDLNMLYRITGGTYANDELKWYVRDVDADTYTEVSSVQNVIGPTSLPTGKFTTSQNRDYELVGYITSTTAVAFSYQFDDVRVSPQQPAARGPIVTDWQPYTAIVSGLGTGALASQTAYWKRVADSIVIRFRGVKDGNAGSGSAAITVSAPPVVGSFDFTRVPNDGLVGSGVVAATNRTPYLLSSAPALIHVGQGSDATGGSAIRFTTDPIPVLGWSSNTVMSNETTFAATRILAQVNSVSASTSNPLAATASVDTLKEWTGSAWVPKKPGIYSVGVTYISSGAGATPMLFRNGVSIGYFGSTPTAAAACAGLRTIQITSADVGIPYDIRPGGAITASAVYISIIEDVNGMQQIAAVEKVVLKVRKNTDQSIPNGALTDVTGWMAPIKDTHGIFNPTTGVATLQPNRTYRVSGNISFATNGAGVRQAYLWCSDANQILAGPQSNGVNEVGASTLIVVGSTAIDLRIRAYQTSGAPLNIVGAQMTGNDFSIESVDGV